MIHCAYTCPLSTYHLLCLSTTTTYCYHLLFYFYGHLLPPAIRQTGSPPVPLCSYTPAVSLLTCWYLLVPAGARTVGGDSEWVIRHPITTTINSHAFPSLNFKYIQFNSIQFDSIQFNSIQFDSIQFNSIQGPTSVPVPSLVSLLYLWPHFTGHFLFTLPLPYSSHEARIFELGPMESLWAYPMEKELRREYRRHLEPLFWRKSSLRSMNTKHGTFFSLCISVKDFATPSTWRGCSRLVFFDEQRSSFTRLCLHIQCFCWCVRVQLCVVHLRR